MKNVIANKYGICITHRNGSIGWVVGNDCKILLFKTKAETVKALHLMKKDLHYSWNCEADVAEFTGYGKRVPPWAPAVADFIGFVYSAAQSASS